AKIEQLRNEKIHIIEFFDPKINAKRLLGIQKDNGHNLADILTTLDERTRIEFAHQLIEKVKLAPDSDEEIDENNHDYTLDIKMSNCLVNIVAKSIIPWDTKSVLFTFL